MPTTQVETERQAFALSEALNNPAKHPALREVLDRWKNVRHVVKQNDEWRLEGFVSFFQFFHEIMNAVDPSFPVRLPPQCFDPDLIARLFRLPDDAFDAQKIEGKNDDGCSERIASTLEHLADGLAPEPPDVVGTSYVANRIGCTQVWITDMARAGQIPRHCLVEGTGNGKPWKFHRKHIDRWLKTR